MAGNAREWVSDSGDFRSTWTVGITRGGFWFDFEEVFKSLRGTRKFSCLRL